MIYRICFATFQRRRQLHYLFIISKIDSFYDTLPNQSGSASWVLILIKPHMFSGRHQFHCCALAVRKSLKP